MAVVGTDAGVALFTGVNTGTLTMVGTAPYAPSSPSAPVPTGLAEVKTLGITLDGKYVVAGAEIYGPLIPSAMASW